MEGDLTFNPTLKPVYFGEESREAPLRGEERFPSQL